MGQPAAKKGDKVVATDTHIVMVPSPGGPVPTPLPHPFAGIINGALSGDVNIMGMPAATVDSTADNTPAHVPTPPTSAQLPDAQELLLVHPFPAGQRLHRPRGSPQSTSVSPWF